MKVRFKWQEKRATYVFYYEDGAPPELWSQIFHLQLLVLVLEHLQNFGLIVERLSLSFDCDFLSFRIELYRKNISIKRDFCSA